MNILILEDEFAAQQNLEAIIHEVAPGARILAILESVKDAQKWFQKNQPPDLAFFDIQLSDGIVFSLFRKISVNFPVIFTTAYDQYALKAFKVNSIDYILKPVSNKSVKFAIRQYHEMLKSSRTSMEDKLMAMLSELKQSENREYRKTFLVQHKDKLIPIDTESFHYFTIQNGIVYAYTRSNDSFVINQTLDEIIKQLNPATFYRANRQFIVSRSAIAEISPYFNERLSVKLTIGHNNSVIISKSRATSFKSWLSE